MANQQNRISSERESSHFREVNVERVASYDVYDRNNDHIGSTTAIWMDQSGQPAFLGVKTTWLFGKTHVVPAHGAEMSHERERIRIPYLSEEVKNAPSYDPDDELDEAKQREVFAYYRERRADLPDWQQPQQTHETRATERETAAPSRTEGETTIPLHEEHLNVGKREVETGGVRLRKIVRTEVVQQPVELKREEIAIERVPASEQTHRTGEKAFAGEEVYIPLRREEPVVGKEVHVREEIRARKTTGTEERNVSGEVRKEDVEIEKQRKAA